MPIKSLQSSRCILNLLVLFNLQLKTQKIFNSLSSENQILTFEKQEQECVLHFFLIND